MSEVEHGVPRPEAKALNAALAAAQGEFPAIPKDKTAKAGSYSYDYADLASILAAVRPTLQKHGLAIVQRLENPGGGKPSIRTELRHAEGDMIAASFPLGEWQTPQQLGSLITYLRRYAIVAMLGIAAEDDDDGRAGATSEQPSRAADTAEGSPFQPPDLLRPDGEELLSDPQRKKIYALKPKLFSDEDFKASLVSNYGTESVSELTKAQASSLIEWMVAKEKELEA